MKIEKRSETRTFYEFTEKNNKGEKITFELIRCTNPGGKNALPYQWKKHGFIDRVLETWWSVNVCVTDADGYCWGRYNPQEKPYMRLDNKGNIVENRMKIDFQWMLEATEENKNKIIEEIEKRAFA